MVKYSLKQVHEILSPVMEKLLVGRVQPLVEQADVVEDIALVFVFRQ